jgi:bifunctional non-homologous end joining protein LigD
MSLAEYARKRNFSATREPRPRRVRASRKPRFVVQKHAASHLHYDFRLEIGGTLKSWAVPKGIPFRKGDKRLAIEVEDHPVSYIDFEGTIPKGQYGGGTVLIWDHGTFDTGGVDPIKAHNNGKISFLLTGKKLKGEWHLVRLRTSAQWLLIKSGTHMKPVSKLADDTSAKSGRRMEQLTERGRVWQSDRNLRPKGRSGGAANPTHKRVSKAKARFISPMLAKPLATPPAGDWFYELKIDGYRALILKNGDYIQLLSRNEKDLGDKFPEVVEAAREIQADQAILDGEVAAFDPRGHSSFQLLQSYDARAGGSSVLYVAFDLLELEGADLRDTAIEQRRLRLKKLVPSKGLIQFSPSLGSDAPGLLQQLQKYGLEGLIGKRVGSRYEAGTRSGTWVKLKLTKEQEVVIGGYTDPEGARSSFGSLLAGIYEAGHLKFCGKIGTGFDQRLLGDLKSKMDALNESKCPFSNLPEPQRGRYGQGITLSEMKRCHWVRPVLVCQVKFTEWTRDRKMRHPVFLGLRPDKAARDVVRECV